MGPSRRGRDSLRRARGKRSLSKRIFVVCEGRTEKDLINQLRRRYRLPGVEITAIAQGQGPMNVVKRAQQVRRQEEADEIWVAFDRDEHACWADALDRARRGDFLLAVSHPCVELWAVLLHKNHSAALTTREAQRRLESLHDGYDHDKGATISLDRISEPTLDIACERAEDLLRRARDRGDPLGNPTTRFHRLVRHLQELRTS